MTFKEYQELMDRVLEIESDIHEYSLVEDCKQEHEEVQEILQILKERFPAYYAALQAESDNEEDQHDTGMDPHHFIQFEKIDSLKQRVSEKVDDIIACSYILNGYRSKELETIVELAHKISGMLRKAEDYKSELEERATDSESMQYAMSELSGVKEELYHDMDELLDKHPDEIAQAVRIIVFGLPKPLPEKAFGCTITQPEPILESVK